MKKLLVMAAAFLSLGVAWAAPQQMLGRYIYNPTPMQEGSWGPLLLNQNGELKVSCSGCSGGGGGGAVTQSGTWTVGVNNFPAVQAVTGTFWQTTQPISGAVSVSNLPSTQAVSGTFWQTTQPISGAVSVSNFPATQPVSGTFWQATQPISGSVSVSNFPSTQAVSGTFWQATQPISGTIAVSNFPGTQAVSGTFWPATQPVSGTVTANQTPTTAGGLLISSRILTATTNATVVKASAGQVYNITTFNNSAVLAYLKLYDKATAPVCGTDVPTYRIMIPLTATGPLQIPFENGLSFSSGIGYCVVTTIPDNGAVAVAASAYIVNIAYK